MLTVFIIKGQEVRNSKRCIWIATVYVLVFVFTQRSCSIHPHRCNSRSFSWDGQKRTSVSSMIWFCLPSSPGGLCTFSLWGWRKGRCLCNGRTTPRGPAGQTPPYGLADSASLDGPVRGKHHIVFMLTTEQWKDPKYDRFGFYWCLFRKEADWLNVSDF